VSHRSAAREIAVVPALSTGNIGVSPFSMKHFKLCRWLFDIALNTASLRCLSFFPLSLPLANKVMSLASCSGTLSQANFLFCKADDEEALLEVFFRRVGAERRGLFLDVLLRESPFLDKVGPRFSVSLFFGKMNARQITIAAIALETRRIFFFLETVVLRFGECSSQAHLTKCKMSFLWMNKIVGLFLVGIAFCF
jgi:hypothetical protein